MPGGPHHRRCHCSTFKHGAKARVSVWHRRAIFATTMYPCAPIREDAPEQSRRTLVKRSSLHNIKSTPVSPHLLELQCLSKNWKVKGGRCHCFLCRKPTAFFQTEHRRINGQSRLLARSWGLPRVRRTITTATTKENYGPLQYCCGNPKAKQPNRLLRTPLNRNCGYP